MSLGTILLIAATIYVIGFVLSVWINSHFPVTPGLLWLRSFLWPLWMVGLIPGEPQLMD